MTSSYLWLLIIPAGVLALAVIFLLVGVIYRRTSGRCTSTNRMTGKTVIVTGANAGIGYWTAHDLASRGARVILACRNADKAEKARETIICETKNENVFVKIVDVSDLNSVRHFCHDILTTEERLNVLINNAGGTFGERKESEQGHEMTLATNHYGNFLMTNLLLGLLKKSTPSRIINVSSLAHKKNNFDIKDLHFKTRKYDGFKAYSQSKLCNILFTKELSHKLIGSGVTVNAVNPGLVRTEIWDKGTKVFGELLRLLSKIIMKDSYMGAQTTIYLSVADEVAEVTGKYFIDCKIAECSRTASDSGLAERLWEISENEVGPTTEEKV